MEWYDSDAEISGTLVDTDIDTANEDPTTVTVTNAAGDLIASTYVTADNGTATASNLTPTQDWDQGGNCAGAGYLIADGANETVGWDRNASGISGTFIHVAAVFEESGGAAPTTRRYSLPFTGVG